jgi:hypothetical protein
VSDVKLSFFERICVGIYENGVAVDGVAILIVHALFREFQKALGRKSALG